MAQCFNFISSGRLEGWITIGDFALVLGLNISVMDFLWQLAKEFSSSLNFRGTFGRFADMVTPEIQDAPKSLSHPG